jgi:hypothetical protein
VEYSSSDGTKGGREERKGSLRRVTKIEEPGAVKEVDASQVISVLWGI